MFFFVSQIVLDALALQMRGQRSPSTQPALILFATRGAGRQIVVLFRIGLRFEHLEVFLTELADWQCAQFINLFPHRGFHFVLHSHGC